MLTLIRREIVDHLLYIVVTCAAAALWIWIAVYVVLWANEPGMLLVFSMGLIPALLIGYCGLGASQMYGDRAHRISTLLCTLAVTRTRVLVARVVVGALTVLATIVPLAIGAALLLRLVLPAAGPFAAFRARAMIEVGTTVALAGFACYCMGLLVGWTTNKTWLLVGGVLLLAMAIFLVLVVGFGLQAMAILLALIAGSLLVTWDRFTSTSL